METQVGKSNLSELAQIRRTRNPVIRRYEGNSEFIRAKFDSDYEPKLRVIKGSRSLYSEHHPAKKAFGQDKLEELLLLSLRAQE